MNTVGNVEQHNLLVIGNGFDLSHDLKTKYIDFINYIKDEKNNQIEFVIEAKSNEFYNYFKDYPGIIDGWIDLEMVIKNLIKNIESIFEYNYCEQGLPHSSNFKRHDILIQNLCSSFNSVFKFSNNSIPTVTINKKFSHNFFKINKKKIIKFLREKFDAFVNIFEKYLEQIVKIDDIKMQKQISNINAKKIISFNYTKNI